ncbi:MAG: formate/nitrite transporter family protein [Lachnospiraceae bacterium]|nr:formate/nitrite transporter family protein [Lachnospiraceae bacterium]
MDSFYTPSKIVDITIQNGVKKVKKRKRTQLLLGFLAGMFIAFAAYSGTMAMHSVSSAGPARVLGGAIFPVGLMLVIFLGAELFTGNCLISLAVWDKKVKAWDMFKNLGIVFFGNLLGALFIVVLCFASGLWNTSGGLLGAYTINTALTKATLSPISALTSGILCNILVCGSILVMTMSTDMTGKIWGIFFTIMAFVVCGFEHSVANMYYLLAGLFAKLNPSYIEVAQTTYGLTSEQINSLNILTCLESTFFVSIGNMIGGMVFVSAIFFTIFRKWEKEDHQH